jgi:hypothetical protein
MLNFKVLTDGLNPVHKALKMPTQAQESCSYCGKHIYAGTVALHLVSKGLDVYNVSDDCILDQVQEVCCSTKCFKQLD